MNKEEILAISEEEINKMIAEKFFDNRYKTEYRAYDKEETGSYTSFAYKSEAYEWDNRIKTKYPNHPYSSEGGHIKEVHVYANYCHDLNLAYEVEEKLLEVGKSLRYSDILYDMVSSKRVNWSKFSYIHASPIDRLRAALLTLEGVKE